VVDSQMQ